MKLGLLGGTFDPIHRGHLRLAAAAEKAVGLERIYFAPAAQPWHKRPPRAGYADRYAMVALALEGHAGWQPVDIPVQGPTYTIDQVEWLQARHPRDRIYLIVGADAMVTLPSWKRYRSLPAKCDFIVAARGGIRLEAIEAILPAGGRPLHWLPRFARPESSTQVRRRARLDEVPARVAEYARRAKLYN